MNIENIKALAEILQKTGLTSLEVCEGDTKIKLERAPSAASEQIAFHSPVVPQSPVPIAQTEPVTLDFNRIVEIKSPIVGVFYSASSPDAEPYISIGSRVKKGDVLCIIEAMKLMNEITAECDGEIVDICVRNGDIVEFGQVLFKIF
jgi:acetyl-CoA carboxylase biotin carboxyl carrier protein